MLEHLRPALALTAGLTVLTGVAYPLAITGLAQVLLPAGANGSLVAVDGRVVGSRSIGQHFADPKWFHGRPSATATAPYDAAGSSGSNLGPLSKTLIDRVTADVARLKAETGATAVPADAVTTSASGLDPHVSPAYARLQVTRIAGVRRLAPETLETLIADHTRGRDLGFLGEPRVNVLELNLALARLGSS